MCVCRSRPKTYRIETVIYNYATTCSYDCGRAQSLRGEELISTKKGGSVRLNDTCVSYSFIQFPKRFIRFDFLAFHKDCTSLTLVN